MKKISTYILFLLLFISSSVWAVEGMTIFGRQDFKTMKTITFLCVTAVDGSFSQQISNSAYAFMGGWMVGQIRITNLSTQTDPTVDSDITFPIETGGSFDLLWGAGTDALDNDTTNVIRPKDPTGSPYTMFITDQFYIEVANNAVSTAVFTIMFILLPQ